MQNLQLAINGNFKRGFSAAFLPCFIFSLVSCFVAGVSSMACCPKRRLKRGLSLLANCRWRLVGCTN